MIWIQHNVFDSLFVANFFDFLQRMFLVLFIISFLVPSFILLKNFVLGFGLSLQWFNETKLNLLHGFLPKIEFFKLELNVKFLSRALSSFLVSYFFIVLFPFLVNSRPSSSQSAIIALLFFFLRRIKNVSLYLILPLFQHFAWYLFDISRLVSLFSHSESDFEHQLLSKAIQNEQSQYKKLKSEVETG